MLLKIPRLKGRDLGSLGTLCLEGLGKLGVRREPKKVDEAFQEALRRLGRLVDRSKGFYRHEISLKVLKTFRNVTYTAPQHPQSQGSKSPATFRGLVAQGL